MILNSYADYLRAVLATKRVFVLTTNGRRWDNLFLAAVGDDYLVLESEDGKDSYVLNLAHVIYVRRDEK